MTKDMDVNIAQLMREASPFLRLVMIFRNPVERYYSAFYYYRWWKKDEPEPGPEDFHAEAERDIATWQACVEKSGVQNCVKQYNPQQLVKGMYSEFLGDWLDAFPRDQLLILRNEDYKVAQKQHMDAVFRFLDVRELSESEWGDVMGMPAKNVQKKRAPMLPQTKQLLDDFYAPFNKALAEALGDERYLWKDEETAGAPAAAVVAPQGTAQARRLLAGP
jgi:N-acetylgalactosamine 4-sulfate 6-O-sulfotransferase